MFWSRNSTISIFHFSSSFYFGLIARLFSYLYNNIFEV
uniref:Uncharacterized protein n=1 Tax=Myoviridae sp. ctZ2t4 TaxID=2827693 RepID=A0A8S5SSV5_9CAUD|nr:MAG TPA: hypothetical protein [Myoviridae sp. ctZ2t4]